TSTAQTTTVSIHSGAAIFGTTTAQYTEQGALATLSPTASVTDTSGTTLVGATVALTSGAFAGDELRINGLLNGTAGTNITYSYNTGTETLTLTGTDTLAAYQSVLDSVTFDSPSDNPTDFGSDPTRTVTWTVNDGSTTGTTSSTLSIT